EAIVDAKCLFSRIDFSVADKDLWHGRPTRNGPLLPHLVEILDERLHRAVDSLDLRVRRLDDVVLVGRVGAAAVAEAEVARGHLAGLAGEAVAGVRAGVARPQHRVDAGALQYCDLPLDQA